MDKKHILGLDLGTNSIGWAVVNETTEDNGESHIDGIVDAGSRGATDKPCGEDVRMLTQNCC